MINVTKFRRRQTIISILIFITVFLVFWNTTKFKLEDIQLSYWGIENFGWVWNLSIVILSISTFINVYFYIDRHPRIGFKNFLIGFFLFTSISLFITGIITMNYNIHTITAYLYFFSYPLAIFTLSHLNRKNIIYKEWLIHLIISITMIIIPLILFKYFVGAAIAESVHSLLVMIWNIWLLFDD